MRDCYRPPFHNLLAEKGDYTAVAAQHIAETGGYKRGFTNYISFFAFVFNFVIFSFYKSKFFSWFCTIFSFYYKFHRIFIIREICSIQLFNLLICNFDLRNYGRINCKCDFLFTSSIIAKTFNDYITAIFYVRISTIY